MKPDMVFAIVVYDSEVHVWSRAGDDVQYDTDDSYCPTIYVSAKDEPLTWLHERLENDPKVNAVTAAERRTSLRDRARSTVLQIQLDRPSEITTLAREIRTVHEPEEWAPGTFRLYNVDFGPKFRYCLETETDPTPPERLRPFSLSIPEKAITNDEIAALQCQGEPAGDSIRRSPSSLTG